MTQPIGHLVTPAASRPPPAGVVDPSQPAITGGRWVVRTFAGWTVGFVLAIVLLIASESIGMPAVQFPLALGMALGVGAFQARVLRAAHPASSGWTMATALGLSAPFVVFDVLQLAGVGLPFSLPVHVALGGVAAAILQWRLIRRHEAHAWWWLVATPPGWLLAGSTVWISELLPRTAGLVGALIYVMIILAGGVVLGLAGVLAWRLMARRTASR